jgi:hypothetical protein
MNWMGPHSVETVFTIAAQKTFELRHFMLGNGDAGGNPCNEAGAVEVYATVKIW